MMKRMNLAALVLVLGLGAPAQPHPVPYPHFPPKDSTLRVMNRVAHWQLEEWKGEGMKYPAWDWVNAVSYTGLFALGQLSGDTTYWNTLRCIGDSLQWETGPARTMADDYCIGQTYAQLYIATEARPPAGTASRPLPAASMLRPFRHLADSLLRLPHSESLEWKNHVQLRQWAWCDALFMGPPGLAYLSTATGDRRYLDLADSLWWKTTAYLYAPGDSLYYRDSRYFGQHEANGQPMFWSRGNGWVMAGLVRMLANMPERYPDRPRFIRLYREMAARVAGLQQPDGTWHASLLDPANFPGPETSGTGLYCYALAWGINRGLLPAARYATVVANAWAALMRAVQPDGRLGYVQQIGENPQRTGASSTEAYGTGAFLLAGTEVYKMGR
ncbi:glycoside hydrolase family 88/105 protein [Dinghuibacter silviterrae]|nr:glycoside hydrolase family 88 protein [Dinghuibacter silviterrae]